VEGYKEGVGGECEGGGADNRCGGRGMVEEG